MPDLNDVYRKFGETSEAAQLLETELGTILLENQILDHGKVKKSDVELSNEIMRSVNRSTLGQLMRELNKSTKLLDEITELLSNALMERNRLIHSFHRQHNMLKFSEKGRAVMMDDLEKIHTTIFEANKAVLMLSGIDLDSVDTNDDFPSKQLPI